MNEFTQVKKDKRTVGVGDLIIVHGLSSDFPCIIVQIDFPKVAAVSLEDGFRVSPPVSAFNPLNLSEDEMNEITCRLPYDVIDGITISKKEAK